MFTAVARSLCGRLIMDRHTPAFVPILARLYFRPADPFAVHMTFPTAVSYQGGQAEWVFARDLLAAGMERPAGEGDVHIRPWGSDRTVIDFISRDGCAMVELSSRGLNEFLRWAYAAVPAGDESAYLDLDTVVAALLHGT